MARYFWKWLDEHGRSRNGGSYRWSLPTWDAASETWVPGAWTPKVPLKMCVSGWHACRDKDLRHWIGPTCWVLEVADGAKIECGNDKIATEGPVRLVAGTAWDERTARLFAARCALDVLPVWESRHPNDSRVADAIVVAIQHANGVPVDLSAACSAAEIAAWSAAESAAWSAARSAACSAAEIAAWSAARSAAWSAARIAAWSAARSAVWSAAWCAVWSAAESAARSAAESAAWSAQSRRLVRYLHGDIDL